MARHPIDLWISRTLRHDPPRAKSLLMTVFGDAIVPHGGSVWLGSLIALLSPLGLNERLVRTSVYRLVEEGWLEASRSGRRSQYRLSARGEKRFLRAHQKVYAPPQTLWDGQWLLAILPPDLSSAQKLQLKKELLWEGFGLWAPGLFAYPGDKQEALSELIARTQSGGKVMVLSASDAALKNTMPLATISVWNLKEAAKSYKKFIARFETLHELIAKAPSVTPTQAFALRTLLIHAYRRTLLSDPQLPAELLDNEWPGGAAYSLCRTLYQTLDTEADRQVVMTLSLEQEKVTPVATEFAHRFLMAHS